MITPEQIEFHRNIFEKWCKNNGHSIDGLQGAYLNLNTHRAWIAWIAAIESIEIEFPDEEESDHFSPDYYEGYDASAGAISECLQSLGLKVKGR